MDFVSLLIAALIASLTSSVIWLQARTAMSRLVERLDYLETQNQWMQSQWTPPVASATPQPILHNDRPWPVELDYLPDLPGAEPPKPQKKKARKRKEPTDPKTTATPNKTELFLRRLQADEEARRLTPNL